MTTPIQTVPCYRLQRYERNVSIEGHALVKEYQAKHNQSWNGITGSLLDAKYSGQVRHVRGYGWVLTLTPVIFRILEKEVIALFPYEPFGRNGWDCTSYMHVGQHGAADPRLVQRTRPATPAEYAALKSELESEPYNYHFRVLQRFPRNAYRIRQAELARMDAAIKAADAAGIK